MSLKNELEKVLAKTSIACAGSDQADFIAPLLAEVDALEQNVAAVLAHPAVSIPAIAPAVVEAAKDAAVETAPVVDEQQSAAREQL